MSQSIGELNIVTLNPNGLDLHLSQELFAIANDAVRVADSQTGSPEAIQNLLESDNKASVHDAHERYARAARDGALVVAFARGVPVGYAFAHKKMPGNIVDRTVGRTVNSATAAARRLLPDGTASKLARFDRPINARFEAVVDQEYRGRGVGRTLINEALKPFNGSEIPSTVVHEKDIATAVIMNSLGLKPPIGNRKPSSMAINVGKQEAPVRLLEFFGQTVTKLRQATQVTMPMHKGIVAHTDQIYSDTFPKLKYSQSNTKADIQRIASYLEWAQYEPMKHM